MERNNDKKDQIILQQLELIRSMTERDLRRMGTDFWGRPQVPASEQKKTSEKAPSQAGGAAAQSRESPKEEASPPERIEEFVAGLPVERFFGIGEVTAEKMHRLGIRTGADLRLWNEAALVQQFGKAGHSYYGYARGIDEREVTPNRVRKSLGAETTFAEDTDDRERLRLELSAVREEVWNRVMRHEFRGKTVVLKLKFDNFRQITRSKTLFTPVDSAETLRRVSEELLAAADFHGRKIRLIGLTVGNSPEACPECVQLRFDFGNPET